MSDQPKVPQKSPIKMVVEAGKTYYWCSCGESSNQPFCDGSHKGTDITPQVFTVEDTKTYYLCNCKSTGNGPFCDGSHNK